ncbi:hypothetical protein [Glutamicibacter ardleyensis]|uniref:hypothetical protein n=1 Tax=Glutamicibacter ardleyensis TaxID=225894 RepID=UPI003FD28A33
MVAASGADSEMEHLPALRQIAATVVVDPAGEHWMEVSKLLAEATGTEPVAQRISAELSQRAAQLKDMLQVPAGTTASLVAGSGHGLLGIAKEDGPHARLFSDLGFQVAGAPRKFDTSTLERQDFSFIRAADLPAAASGEALFLLSADESQAASFSTSEPAAQLPAVQAGNLFALEAPFVLDFYSAQQILDYFEHDFPGLAAQDR